MTVLLILVLLVVLGAGGFAVALAVNGKRGYDKQGQIVPGEKSGAPAHWAGDHSPEAKIHRRLGELVRGLRSTEMPDDVRLLDARVTVEQQAVAIDKLLIAVAALPKGEKRSARIAEISATVEQLIETAADVQGALPPAAIEGANLDAIVNEVNAARERMQALVTVEPGVSTPTPEQAARYTF